METLTNGVPSAGNVPRPEPRPYDHDVETNRRGIEAPTSRQGCGCTGEALLLVGQNGVEALLQRFARLHLDDHKNTGAPSREIDFAERRAQAVTKNSVAFAHQPQGGGEFSEAAAAFRLATPPAHAPALSASARA